MVFGIEKSFISLFIIIPVSGTMTCEPNKRFIDVVIEMARPEESAATMCEVPGVLGTSMPDGS